MSERETKRGLQNSSWLRHSTTFIWRKLPDLDTEWRTIIEDAKLGSAAEHEMSARSAFKLYRKACFWSFVVSMCVVMEGYDLRLISSLYALPAFRVKYGSFYPGTGYQISATWQTSLSMGNTIGAFLGILLTGPACDRWGYRKTLLGALAVMVGTIFCTFFAPSIRVLLVGEVCVDFPGGHLLPWLPLMLPKCRPWLSVAILQYTFCYAGAWAS